MNEYKRPKKPFTKDRVKSIRESILTLYNCGFLSNTDRVAYTKWLKSKIKYDKKLTHKNKV